ncbi:unnamed protein product [Porites lobata]|uniref:Uncharacterized protein n=1 Tax=Porites lobata TaxID=104759 RepID=A0ABN8NBK7_9CNID|nr:unnamed protein product [Porites lobata]
MAYLDSDQEEADTKILLHAVDAIASGAKSIKIFLPDTNMFVLALRRYPELCADSSFVTRRGQRHRNIPLFPIVRTLRAARTAALPGFHAWSGVDVSGNFAFKGKLECWKELLQADEECVTALADLSSTILPTAGMFYAIEKLVCLCSCSNYETGDECDNVDMIEDDSCDDETSDKQEDDSEEDEDDE